MSRNIPFFPKKTWRRRAPYKSRNTPAFRKRRKEGPCTAGKFPGFYAVTLHTIHMQTVSFSGEEEGAKDELKVTQNWLNQFHVSGEVGRNFA